MKIFIEVGNLGRVLKYYANFIIRLGDFSSELVYGMSF